MDKTHLSELVLKALADMGLTLASDDFLYNVIALGLMMLLSMVMFYAMRVFYHTTLLSIIRKTRNTWDDELQKHRFFRRAGHMIPAILFYLLAPALLIATPLLLELVQKISIIYMLVSAMTAGMALFNTVQDVYNASALSKRAPITGFIQVGKLLLVIVATLLIISTLLDKSPLLLLSGLGAVTAILLLLFRDTILGFVAGIQIAANRMVNTGDWIEMPKFGADGDVLEVGLTTVKVQNWDKTITTIPTYALISESVKNWRGMENSGGRRIKRALHIDLHTIGFADDAQLESFKGIRFISHYIDKKVEELRRFQKDNSIDESDLVNQRRLTNIGTFRAYVEAYLHSHPKLNKDMTMMVRQLPPTELGLPLEIYCFSREKSWVVYEQIQADIFDHILSMLPVFGLRAYQRVGDANRALALADGQA